MVATGLNRQEALVENNVANFQVRPSDVELPPDNPAVGIVIAFDI
jgi:hypothetical protein